MQKYVATIDRHPDQAAPGRPAGSDHRAPRRHARLLNTLSRMEYVGVRKMLKSRRSEHLDLDGLQHMLDETIHALRLKKAALAAGRRAQPAVDTYSADDTLAGDAGEAYLQGVDRAAETALADLDEQTRARPTTCCPAPPSRCAPRPSIRSTKSGCAPTA